MKDKRTFLLFMLFYLLLVYSNGLSQTERETRAVWVATNFRLDWPPPTFDQEQQKKALIEIFDNVKSKNLNTVYFQAGSSGTVLFKSSFEPFSPYITGEVNGKPSYDPLQFAVEQAHKHGLEIHAWINIVKCFNGTEYNILKNPKHISQRKPGWVIEDFRNGERSFWLDPGLPEVREYISDMITEMVEDYDIDGVHLDYIRYPGKNFDDEFSYRVYGNGLVRDEWRRKNITDLVEQINKKIKAVKHHIKLGAAPIGVYQNQKGMTAWEGFSEVYQDSREWLRRGIVDYIAPQIYWGIDDNPRFEVVAKEWIQNSFGRSIVLGIGAYKENVKPDIEKMISFSRNMNADGVAFFRYSNIKDNLFASFSHKTYPASMPWLDGIYPPSPSNFIVSRTDNEKNIFSLNWDNKTIRGSSDSVNYYALYNLPKPDSELLQEYLFDLISAQRSSLVLSIEKPKKVNYYFCLKSVNKLWNESVEASNVVELEVPAMKNLIELNYDLDKPTLIKETDDKVAILLFSQENEKITLIGLKGTSRHLLMTDFVLAGKNYFALQIDMKNYDALRIYFESTKREAELKF